MASPELRLDWIGSDAAAYATKHWHYSKTVPVSKQARLGVWEDSEFIGAVIYSNGSAGVRSIGPGLGLSTVDVGELARVALRAHRTPVSRIVAISLRLLKKAQPGIKLIVSYADPRQNHTGGIYQAGNWVYVGRSSPQAVYVDKDGREWHSRSVSERGWTLHMGEVRVCPRPSELRKIVLKPKFRYYMALDGATQQLIEPLRKPYPTRQDL